MVVTGNINVNRLAEHWRKTQGGTLDGEEQMFEEDAVSDPWGHLLFLPSVYIKEADWALWYVDTGFIRQ